MDTLERIAAVSAHLNNIAMQAYTVCALDIAAAVKDAGAAVGLAVLTGQINTDNNTIILYK